MAGIPLPDRSGLRSQIADTMIAAARDARRERDECITRARKLTIFIADLEAGLIGLGVTTEEVSPEGGNG